jgi:FtsP/CotA-like multicopper oxidase with cupredoxin domain
MNTRPRLISSILFGAVIFAAAQTFASAQGVSTSTTPCPRFAPGSTIVPPEDLFSRDGVLTVNFKYLTMQDSNNLTRFCFVAANGAQSPTLHVRPGDTIVVNVTNDVPASAAASAIFSQAGKAGRYRNMSTPRFKDMLEMMLMHPQDPSTVCGDAVQTPTSLNIHYHGTNTSPTCHSDEVIHTLINSGSTFSYHVRIPADEPPGMYWYHPHIHGIAEAAVQGGASGAIIVEGIANIQPAVADLPERILIIRDQPIPGAPTPSSPPGSGPVPSWDLTLNYAVIPYVPNQPYTPAVIPIRPNEKQLWRVVNATADTVLDLQLQYDGVPQTLGVVGFDGVPTGSQDGTRQGTILPQTDILIPTAGRAEFIVTGPSASVKNATFMTLFVNTGPIGDNDPTRPLATLAVRRDAPELRRVAAATGPPSKQRFESLESVEPNTKRLLYFSEVLSDPNNPSSPTNFFITVDGATPQVFEPTNPPAIVTTQGAVEDWTIQNRAKEHHEFHFHQIHFLLLAINGVPVPPSQQQYFDMYQVPFWPGSGPYPSITVRMDFRGPDIGQFVYHCHILGHEDNGMMAIIQVNPRDENPDSSRPKKAAASAASTGATDPTRRIRSEPFGFVTNLVNAMTTTKVAAPARGSSKPVEVPDKK